MLFITIIIQCGVLFFLLYCFLEYFQERYSKKRDKQWIEFLCERGLMGYVVDASTGEKTLIRLCNKHPDGVDFVYPLTEDNTVFFSTDLLINIKV